MSTKNEIFEYVMDTPGNTNGAVLKSLLENLDTSVDLPEPTSEDIGKILGVVEDTSANPVYGLVEQGGGTSFKVTYTTANMQSATCDKTYAEVEAALESGEPIDCALALGNTIVGKITSVIQQEYGIVFSMALSTTTSVYVFSLTHHADGTVRIVSQEAETNNFIVTFSGSTDDGNAACDKTLTEIVDAYNEGHNIITQYLYDDGSIAQTSSFKLRTIEGSYALFTSIIIITPSDCISCGISDSTPIVVFTGIGD